MSFKNIPLKMNGETKFVRVIICCKLNWSNYNRLIASKIGKIVGILCKVRYILNEVSCLVM